MGGSVSVRLPGSAPRCLFDPVDAGLPAPDEQTGSRTLAFWRMPSTSRAYPLSLEKKAAAYRQLFQALGMVP